MKDQAPVICVVTRIRGEAGSPDFICWSPQ